MKAIVGIDIGGSSQTAIAYDFDGAVLGRASVEAAADGGDDVIHTTLQVISDLRMIAGLPDFEIVAVGVGIPGQVDDRRGEVTTAVNLGIGVESYPLAAQLEAHLRCPVTVENDVRAAALGVYTYLTDSGESPASLVFLNIGTGISAGVVLDGEIVRGAHGMAGEIGHVVIDPTGPQCRCGQHGCLEAIAAGPALARAWPRGSNPARSLFAASLRGEAGAIAVAEPVTRDLVTALSWLAATYDTERLVLGGGVTRAGAPLLGALRTEIARRAGLSEIAARRLQPQQVTLVDPDQFPGPLGASMLARRTLLEARAEPAGTSKRRMSNKGAAV